MTFTSPIWLFVAVLMAIALFIVAWLRRPALPRVSHALIACGVIALILSIGGISCRGGREPRVAVMVDVSPSTRGASFRDLRWVESRARGLLGDTPFDVYAFADTATRLQASDAIHETSVDHTTLPPVDTGAILLFSDGRFDAPPVTPPIYAVIDPALSSPVDAAVVDLQERGTQLTADVRNSGPPRELTWVNQQRHSATAPTGSTVLSTHLVTTTESITARLSPADAWPENDALAIRPSPPLASQRWWVGDSPPRGWMQIQPQNLPTESSPWLGPAIVVLSDVPADAISLAQQDRLTQYVRDLGGALLITGGEHAFAAGHYPGSALESLSPLSSSPPEPVNHWVLLVDSSGSMSAPAGGGAGSRFKLAADALVNVLRELPKSDLVSLGSFARELRWWSIAKSAEDTSILNLPPSDVQPTGPTNLQAALAKIAASLPSSPPVELLVITDAEAQFSDVAKLADDLKSHHIRVDVLLIGSAGADAPLARLANATGGRLVPESNPSQWLATIRRMLRAAMPDELIRQPVSVSFSGILAPFSSRTIALVNRTWLKQSATQLGEGIAGTEKLPVAARWTVGTGDVISLAFAPTRSDVAVIEQAIARHPRDPRFTLSWSNGPTLHVRIDAIDRGQYLNDQKLSLTLSPGETHPIPQSAPGRYELDFPAPRVPTTATILHDARVLNRFALAGRYPREFDAVGNDLDALRSLCARSGGRIIEPTEREPIELIDTRAVTSFASGFAILGALLIGGGLFMWRRG